MNVQATLELLQSHPGSQEHLRLVALELGGALGALEDSQLARLDTGLARLQGLAPEASPWIQGFESALSLLLSGAQQQRRQEREQRSQEQALEELEGSLRQDWRTLLSVMGPGIIRPVELKVTPRMDRSQMSRNLADMVKAGLLERVPVRAPPGANDGRARLFRLTAQGRLLSERLARKHVHIHVHDTTRHLEPAQGTTRPTGAGGMLRPLRMLAGLINGRPPQDKRPPARVWEVQDRPSQTTPAEVVAGN